MGKPGGWQATLEGMADIGQATSSRSAAPTNTFTCSSDNTDFALEIHFLSLRRPHGLDPLQLGPFRVRP
jgi:hypothetical protein